MDGHEAVGGATTTSSRTERKRRVRERQFVDAAKRIVADEGFEALTMQRLADGLDMAVSAVYRYFPSKGALVREIQLESITQLAGSLSAIEAYAKDHWVEDDDDTLLARLVLLGRWFCAASDAYPEEVRLLQTIMSKRSSALDEDGGWKVFPVAMEVIGRAVAAIEAAQDANVLDDGDPVGRAIIWASALGGVLQTNDLEMYSPDLFGQAQLAERANLDLIVGWGAGRSAVERASALVDQLGAETPLAP